jgi:hypothetical protein
VALGVNPFRIHQRSATGKWKFGASLKAGSNIPKDTLVKQMKNWKIISNIATCFGIAFVVYAAISAVLTYESIDMQYGVGNVPANFIQLSILNAMLPFLLYAVLSFLVVAFTSRAGKETPEKEEETQLPEEQPTQTKL